MKRLNAALVSLALLSTPALAADGLVTIPSAVSVKQTIDRLEVILKAGGASIIARVDHTAGAASVDMKLRPTELLIFGTPKGGTPLMQAQQSIGIDLPLKALAYEDEGGKVWLAYNDPVWIAARHGAGADVAKVTDALAMTLKGAAAKAAAAP